MDEAIDFADNFLVLHKGKLLAAGTLEELRWKVSAPSATLGEIFLSLTKGS
jgi:ABC-2 type transport system ATP-binding protein